MSRKVSHKGARQKGNRFEREFVEVAREYGLPAMRVIASGANIGAKADVKVGVELDENGEYPPADEAQSILRAECKNRAINPEWIYNEFENASFAFLPSNKDAMELPYKDLAQDDVSKVVVWRRNKIPKNALKEKNYNEVFLAVMKGLDWIKLVKEVYELRRENRVLRDKIAKII